MWCLRIVKKVGSSVPSGSHMSCELKVVIGVSLSECHTVGQYLPLHHHVTNHYDLHLVDCYRSACLRVVGWISKHRGIALEGPPNHQVIGRGD